MSKLKIQATKCKKIRKLDVSNLVDNFPLHCNITNYFASFIAFDDTFLLKFMITFAFLLALPRHKIIKNFTFVDAIQSLV